MNSHRRLDDASVLIYSHDSFGLGHLRRCREIAHSLVDAFKGIRVLILSGSPIIGSFDFRARVDFVRIPGVVKLRNGDYISLNAHIDIQHTLEMRASIINHTAEVYKPDLFLVDKEPLGLRGEVRETLEKFRGTDTRVVLGLRDIMDDPAALKAEWGRRDIASVLESYYDEVWVYGHPKMGNPLAGIGLAEEQLDRLRFTGYIMRHIPAYRSHEARVPDEPFILVTAGGGGDGRELIDWVLRAYESGVDVGLPALVVLGPFMPLAERERFSQRIAALDNVSCRTFSPNMELLIGRAAAVVCMGGYNTFCEIMSFDKRALLVPRSTPRQEQLIRARRAKSLGLLNYLDGDGPRDTVEMIEALRRLPDQSPPSVAGIGSMLDGLDAINARVGELLDGF